MIKVTPQVGYPNCYAVRTIQEFDQIRRWMLENDVKHLHVCSNPQGVGFEVQSNFEWFNLKWL